MGCCSLLAVFFLFTTSPASLHLLSIYVTFALSFSRSAHPSFSNSLYLLFIRCFSPSKNRIINQSGEAPVAHTLTHSHNQYKQLCCRWRSCVLHTSTTSSTSVQNKQPHICSLSAAAKTLGPVIIRATVAKHLAVCLGAVWSSASFLEGQAQCGCFYWSGQGSE